MSKYLGTESTAIQALSDSNQRTLRRATPMMQGEDIREVQQKLGIQTDGIYGPVTEQAVKNFQQEKGLTVDGIVGPNTWTALDRASSETALAKIGMGSIQKTITNVKGDYWDPLSTTEKIMYGGGVATIIIGAFIAANN